MAVSNSEGPIRIIAAHAGTGKSYLAKMHPDKFTDFVMMPFKYMLPEQLGDSEIEAIKASPDIEMNPEFPSNYIKAIRQALNETDKTLIIPSAHGVLERLWEDNIPYLLCYPENTEESKEEYRRRYMDRGNTEDFLDVFVANWDMFMYFLDTNSYGKKIIMKPWEYLSDVIKGDLY